MTPLRSRGVGWLLVAAAAWTFYVWGTRAWLLAGQDATLGFKVVHFALAAVSLAFGAGVGWVGWRVLRSSEGRDV